MIVVADTSPINYLVQIAESRLLFELYGGVSLPEAVRRELVADRSDPMAREWATRPPIWVRVESIQPRDLYRASASLDAGEREAIALALRLNADLLLMDERQGRREADRLTIATIGTLGVLLAAAHRNLVDLATALTKLRATNCYLSPKLIEEVLRLGL